MRNDVLEKVRNAEKLKEISYERSLSLLEEAHLLAQPFVWPHVYVHWKMLALAWKYLQWKEVVGQIARIILAAPGSILGKAPKGNVGSTKMGIFEERE